VEVVLEVHGRCPGLADPAQVLFVLDTSRSMGSSNAIDRARSVILALLGGFDGDAVEAGLIGYGDGAARLVPMTRDYGRIRAAIAATTADGDTRLTPAIELARTDLAAARRAGLRQVAVVVTDGAYKAESLVIAYRDSATTMS